MEQWYQRVGDVRTDEGRRLFAERSRLTSVERTLIAAWRLRFVSLAR
jgi:hypothetical protein